MSSQRPKTLLLIRGLGGTGKTTLSTTLSKVLGWPVFNRDDIKLAVRKFDLSSEIETEIGYSVMNALAKVQLQNGLSAILDANARFQSMESFYHRMSSETSAQFAVVTCGCENETEWERRISARGVAHPISFNATKEMLLEPFVTSNQFTYDSSSSDLQSTCNEIVRWLGIHDD